MRLDTRQEPRLAAVEAGQFGHGPPPEAQARKKPPPQARQALAAGEPPVGCRRSGRARAPPRRHHRPGADRGRDLPRRGRLPALGRRRARQRRRARRRGSCSARSATRSRRRWSPAGGADPDPRAAPAGAPMRTGIALPGRRDDAGARRRARSGSARAGAGAARSGTPAAFETRGGVVGQGELWVASHLFSTLGAHILAVFLFVAGLILVTGATLAGVIRATGAGVAGTSRALRRSTEDLRGDGRRAGPRPAGERDRAAPPSAQRRLPEPLLPPEPDTAELVVRATHVEAPPIEADERTSRRRRRAPTGRGPSPEPTRRGAEAGRRSRPGARRRTAVDPEDLTPQGRYRALDHRRPRLRVARPRRALPDPLDRRGGQARHRRAGAGRAHAARDARPLRDRGQGDRPGHRARTSPATSCGWRRAPRSPRSPSSRTTSPTRWPPPTSGSWRRSPASRRSASRCPTPAGGSSTSATCSRSRRRTGRR